MMVPAFNCEAMWPGASCWRARLSTPTAAASQPRLAHRSASGPGCSSLPTCAPCLSSSLATFFISALSNSLSTTRLSPRASAASAASAAPPSPPSAAAAPPSALLAPRAAPVPLPLLPRLDAVEAALSCSAALGHTRYSTSRASSARSALPHASSTCFGRGQLRLALRGGEGGAASRSHDISLAVVCR